jgi:MscS family membrane protein
MRGIRSNLVAAACAFFVICAPAFAQLGAPEESPRAEIIDLGKTIEVDPPGDAVTRVEGYLPSILTWPRVLEMSLWQWLALPLLALLAGAIGMLAIRAIRRPLTASTSIALAEPAELVQRTSAPARLIASVVVFLLLLPWVGLEVPAYAAARKVGIVVAAIAFVWLGSRCMDEASRRAVARVSAAGRMDAAGLIPTISRVAKLALAAIVFVVLAQNFGMNVTGVLAGLGVGGLAVALAAQKTVENLFGGVSLVADRPIRVGDFCRFGDRVGTIEAIGLRSTRIRTLDRTVVTIPNAEFSGLQLENYSARDRIWLKLRLGLRYETRPEQLRQVLSALRKLLRDHPRVDPDPARVRFVDLGAYSLDLELFAYIRTRDFDEYLAIREELLLSIMEVVEACGAGFAFPSQTIYGVSDLAPSGPEVGRGASPGPSGR